ncbi:MAG: hypothetical protein ACRCWJ_22960 [Casimicrobium sp.]
MSALTSIRFELPFRRNADGLSNVDVLGALFPARFGSYNPETIGNPSAAASSVSVRARGLASLQSALTPIFFVSAGNATVPKSTVKLTMVASLAIV